MANFLRNINFSLNFSFAKSQKCIMNKNYGNKAKSGNINPKQAKNAFSMEYFLHCFLNDYKYNISNSQ